MSGPSRPCSVEVGLGELGAPGQRGALLPVAADQHLLLAHAGAVPRLDLHLDPAGHQVGASGQPGGLRVVLLADPDELLELLALLGLDVGGAVLEAEQVARGHLLGRGGGGAAEPQLRPAHRHRAEPDPRQVADRVHGHLGVVGAGLDAQVPVAALRVEVVGREVRELAELGRLAFGEAEAVLAVLLEEGRAEPEGQGQAGGAQSEGLPGVGRRGVVRRDDGLADRAAGRHLACCLGPALQHRDQLLAGVGGDVERGEVQPVLGGSGDPGLVGAVEVVPRLVDARRRPRSRPTPSRRRSRRRPLRRPRPLPRRRLRGAAVGRASPWGSGGSVTG